MGYIDTPPDVKRSLFPTTAAAIIGIIFGIEEGHQPDTSLGTLREQAKRGGAVG
jgi:hypothetical protein